MKFHQLLLRSCSKTTFKIDLLNCYICFSLMKYYDAANTCYKYQIAIRLKTLKLRLSNYVAWQLFSSRTVELLTKILNQALAALFTFESDVIRGVVELIQSKDDIDLKIGFTQKYLLVDCHFKFSLPIEWKLRHKKNKYTNTRLF